MTNKLVVANMKSVMNFSDIQYFINNMADYSDNMVICPTSLYIPYFLNKKYKIGCQNGFYLKGPYTGEINFEQLKSMNVDYVVIGHSDRRNLFHETLEEVNKKVIAALNQKLKVILCVGESIQQRQDNTFKDVIKEQVQTALNGVTLLDNLIIAYEPIWSIGTQVIPTGDEISEIISYIRSLITENIKVLYGGSVDDQNIDTLKELKEVDGFFIGGASSDVHKLNKIWEKLS